MGESGANCRTVHFQLHGEWKAAVFPQLVQVTEGALSYHHTMFDIGHAVSVTLGLAAQIDKRMNIVDLFTFYLDMREGLFSNLAFRKLDSFVC